MSRAKGLLARLRSTLRPGAADAEFERELRSHLDLIEEDLQRRGMPASEARLAARREVGSLALTADRHRDARAFGWIDDARQDLVYALRSFRRAPAFAAVTVLTLALGIGANTAIFSLLNTLVLRPLPVERPEELVELLNASYPGESRPFPGMPWKYYETLRDENHVFSDLMAVGNAGFQLSLDAGAPERVVGHYVSGNLFEGLGIRPALGRLIDATDVSGGDSVAVLSWLSWQRRFGGSPDIIGTQIHLDGIPVTVVGITPRAFAGVQLGYGPEVWVPASMGKNSADRASQLMGRFVSLLGRLRPGVSRTQAEAELAVLDRPRIAEMAERLKQPAWLQVRIQLESAASGFSVLRQTFERPVLLLAGIVALVLLIACTNIAGLMLARSSARSREMAVRVALGAGKWRVIRQTLTESLLLASAGAALGLAGARVVAGALVNVIATGRQAPGMPSQLDIYVALDANVLLFTAAITLGSALIFGIAPAWHAFASAPAGSLRDMGGTTQSPSARFFGKTLVVAQVAISIVLLSAAALLIRHLSDLRTNDLGFRRDGLLLVSLDPSGSGYDGMQLSALYRTLIERFEAIPGVRSASLSGTTPTAPGAASEYMTVDGFTEDPNTRRRVMMNWVAPKYFETMATPLIAGRDFSFDDENRQPFAIVNQAAARHYFPGRSAIGQRVTFEREEGIFEIVGVVADAKYMTLHEAPPRTAYLNAFQRGRGSSSDFSLATDVPPSSVVPEVRRVVAEVLDGVSMRNVTTMAEQMDSTLVPERLMASIAGALAALGALLAALGLYGLLAFTVARRTSEFGLRMALGAPPGAIMRMVLASAVGLVAAGLLVGATAAFASRRVIASLIEQLPATQLVPVGIAAAAMLVVALAAAAVPAHRATKIDPLVALRHE